ncbi:MAG: AraC family transcriptional regulator [Chitinophagaceae bacterium]|jgi:AraC-like DNA-binding protein|nr:MAG: AraC family transcriptional regulator [Chitinophagaceae bacterium]
MDQILHIKNMVCDRCIKAVKAVLSGQDIEIENIQLGEVKLRKPVAESQIPALETALRAEGFELIDDKRSRIVSQIKSMLIELIHYGDLEALHQNISGYITQKLHKDYHYLSNLFSESENMTIEQFVIFQKIEKVKELLVYDELSLSEISFKMGYSSVAHLSAQFKKITGFTPSRFKKLKDHKRRPLDKL